MALCLNGRVSEAFYVIAVVCSTWSAVNLATSQRDCLTPLGDTRVGGVNAGNRMVARWGFGAKKLSFVKPPNVFKFTKVCFHPWVHVNSLSLKGSMSIGFPAMLGAFLYGGKPWWIMFAFAPATAMGHPKDSGLWW